MTKYMVLYNSTTSASDLMANASPDEMKASMNDWIKWRDKASAVAKIEFGLPLQAFSRVDHDGAKDSTNTISGYAFIDAQSKDDVVELLKDHPHLIRPDAYIDVLEVLSMPGL